MREREGEFLPEKLDIPGGETGGIDGQDELADDEDQTPLHGQQQPSLLYNTAGLSKNLTDFKINFCKFSARNYFF